VHAGKDIQAQIGCVLADDYADGLLLQDLVERYVVLDRFHLHSTMMGISAVRMALRGYAGGKKPETAYSGLMSQQRYDHIAMSRRKRNLCRVRWSDQERALVLKLGEQTPYAEIVHIVNEQFHQGELIRTESAVYQQLVNSRRQKTD
jgi:hypothetical protein